MASSGVKCIPQFLIFYMALISKNTPQSALDIHYTPNFSVVKSTMEPVVRIFYLGRRVLMETARMGGWDRGFDLVRSDYHRTL